MALYKFHIINTAALAALSSQTELAYTLGRSQCLHSLTLACSHIATLRPSLLM